MAQYLHLSEQLSVKLVAQVRCHFAFTDPQSSSPSEGVFKKKKKKKKAAIFMHSSKRKAALCRKITAQEFIGPFTVKGSNCV